jgi:general L-amino acid transport system permease protein
MAVDDSVPRTVARAPRASLIHDPTLRAIVFQVLIAAALIAFVAWIADNTITNLRRANIASGFGFLS